MKKIFLITSMVFLASFICISQSKAQNKCDVIRAELRDLEQQLKNTEKWDVPPSEPGEFPVVKPKVNKKWTELNKKVNSKRSALRACEESLIPNTPVPLTLTLTKFVCLDQSDDIRFFCFNLEDDEPYALVFAVDINLVANSKMTLVGPLKDVDEGEEYSAPANVIWGLSDAPSLVSSAFNLIVLVVMMENDTSEPGRARTFFEVAAKAGLLNEALLSIGAITRQELINRMISEMYGLDIATFHLDADDQIGATQELRFSQAELDHIYRNLGPIEKSLTFEGDDAKYVLKFRLFR